MQLLHTTPSKSTSQRWAWTGVGVGLLLGVLTQAPAHWLTNAVAEATQQHVLLHDAQGTVWQGSAQWVLNEGAHNTGTPTSTLPTRVQWQIGPSVDVTQLRIALRAEVSSACCTPQPLRFDLSPVWRGIRVQVSDHTSRWPADWLVGLGSPWNTLQPQGDLELQTRQLQWTQQAGVEHLNGQAELQVQQLATRLSTLRPLGNYRVRIEGGDPIQLTLDTLEGSLQLQGHGQLIHGRLRFSGEASASPGTEASLSNLLNILGQRQGAKSILKMG